MVLKLLFDKFIENQTAWFFIKQHGFNNGFKVDTPPQGSKYIK